QEMVMENDYQSSTMCGWNGLSLSPTLSPTREPTSYNEYNGYYSINILLNNIPKQFLNILDNANTTIFNEIDNTLENIYVNESIFNDRYSLFDIVVISINNIKNQNKRTYNSHKRKLNNIDF